MKREEPEDILASPELGQLIRRARDRQPLPRVKISADQIYDAWQAKQQVRTRRWQLSALAIAAALAVITIGASWIRTLDRREPTTVLDLAVAVATSREHAPILRTHAEIPRPSVALEVDAEIATLEPNATPPTIMGPAAVVLGDGTFRVTLAGARPLRVGTPSGELELRPGVFTIAVAGRRTDVILETGEAFWVRDEGLEPVLAPTPTGAPELPETVLDALPSAAELARLAESELAHGRRAQAIRSLRQLVQTYPRAPESSRGLLDLARLQRAAGDTDAARCAYQLYLRRQPKSPLVGDVERALERLGPGRSCRGLQPG